MLRRERVLWAPAAVPALLTAVCLSAAAVLVYGNAGGIDAIVVSALPSLEADAWYEWLWVGPGSLLLWLVRALWLFVVAATALVAGLLTATLLASPVLDVLSQRVERVISGVAAGDDEPLTSAGLVRDALGSLANEARRLARFVALSLAITALGWLVPFGPVLAPLALAMLAIAFLPLEYAGMALDRRRIPFAQRRAWLARHRARSIGLGAAGFAVGLVPGLNFLLLPALIVAGTIFVIETPPEAEDGA